MEIFTVNSPEDHMILDIRIVFNNPKITGFFKKNQSILAILSVTTTLHNYGSNINCYSIFLNSTKIPYPANLTELDVMNGIDSLKPLIKEKNEIIATLLPDKLEEVKGEFLEQFCVYPQKNLEDLKYLDKELNRGEILQNL